MKILLGVVVDVKLAHGNPGLFCNFATVVPWNPFRVKSCRRRARSCVCSSRWCVEQLGIISETHFGCSCKAALALVETIWLLHHLTDDVKEIYEKQRLSRPARLKGLEATLCSSLYSLRGAHPDREVRRIAASLTAADMGVVAAKAAMERAGIQPEQGKKPSLAMRGRPAADRIRRGRFPSQWSAAGSAAFTVNKACARGSSPLRWLPGDSARRCELYFGGWHGIHVAASLLLEARWGYRLGNQELVDGMYRDGFFCPMAKM